MTRNRKVACCLPLLLWTACEPSADADTGSLDTGSLDTGSLDTGSLDTGSLDTGSLDTGSLDTGSLDTGSLDTGSLDTGSLDTGSLDTGSLDTGSDASMASYRWSTESLVGVPARAELLPLPGGGVGNPVLTSNNPEIFTGDGLLYGNARPSPSRGGSAYALTGDFGVYLHHINQSGSVRYLGILITNPNSAPVTIDAHGSGYSQTETGGLGLGSSPDYRVSREWITNTPQTVVTGASLAPSTGMLVWQKRVNNNAEADGRFAIHASAPVFVYVVATSDTSLASALTASRIDAPGDYRSSGTPPPPFGREAGIYSHDTWQSNIDVIVPATGHLAFMVNTATGAGLSPVQAFPALAHYDVSAAEAVGMYGNVYDFDMTVRHDGSDVASRRVRVQLHSLARGAASRWWDGVALVDGREVVIRQVPGAESTVLSEVTLLPGETRHVHVQAMVPGLTSIPQALTMESLP